MRVFNGFGQITDEYQEHSGAVTTGSGHSPDAQYSYDEGTDTNSSRLKSMTYPGGRKVRYEYSTLSGNSGSAYDDAISRVSYVADDSSGSVGTHLEEYSYLGADSVVMRNRPEPDEAMQLFDPSATSGDALTGLDRYGQIKDLKWTNGGGSPGYFDRFEYGYDIEGNRLYRKNDVKTGYDELYHADGSSAGYDGLNRLTDFQVGALSASVSGGTLDTISSETHSQTWTLDALGNPTSVDTDGTPETRTYNRQNELTSQSSTSDNNGNQTASDTKVMKYDAWNRLVKVGLDTDSHYGMVYSYDALGRRINESGFGYTEGETTVPTEQSAHTDLYYSDSWQVVEERATRYTVGTDTDTNETATATYVYSPFYVDEMILRDKTSTTEEIGGDIHRGGHTSDLPGDGGDYATPFVNQSIIDAPDGRVYVQQDANYNGTSLVADTSGTSGFQAGVVARFTEDPYGASTAYNEAMTASGETYSYAFANRNQGLRLDVNTGQYDGRNRVEGDMQWLQQDPVRYSDGDSLYLNRQDNPLSLVDPLGLASGKGGGGSGDLLGPIVDWMKEVYEQGIQLAKEHDQRVRDEENKPDVPGTEGGTGGVGAPAGTTTLAGIGGPGGPGSQGDPGHAPGTGGMGGPGGAGNAGHPNGGNGGPGGPGGDGIGAQPGAPGGKGGRGGPAGQGGNAGNPGPPGPHGKDGPNYKPPKASDVAKTPTTQPK